jgi:hypothetical protein
MPEPTLLSLQRKIPTPAVATQPDPFPALKPLEQSQVVADRISVRILNALLSLRPLAVDVDLG